MAAIGRLLSLANGLWTVVGGIIVVAMVLHITLDVTLRYLFNAPLNGTIAYVSHFYMVAIAFLPIAATEEVDQHISVELVYEMLSARIQSAFTAISLVLSMAVFAILAVRTGQEALLKYNIGTFVVEGPQKIPTWPAYFFLPLGFGLTVLVLGYKLLCHVTGRPSRLNFVRGLLNPEIAADRA